VTSPESVTGAKPHTATEAGPGHAAAAVARPAYQKYGVRVEPSRIDGLGAFAEEAIAARRKIGEIRGESISVAEARIRATRHERIMIVELSARKAIDFSRSLDPMRYTNHSCRPNARLCIRQGRVEFYSLRAIAPREEITVDYGETHHEGRLSCRCGAAGCKGRL
jgi:SET domain-containing protein